MSFQLNTPVAFFIFNRPTTTFRVFAEIRKAKPKTFLVIADGARFSDEIDKCNEARSIIEKVDWECKVLTNFSEKNLGCKLRVSSGLDWVFSEVEEAIILEDDCLPTQSFFYFCQDLLNYYRNDSRVMHISGNNFQRNISVGSYSYFFSKYGGIWGWASWRRAWQFYDRDMNSWASYKRNNVLNYIYDDWAEKLYWTDIFNKAANGIPDTWDYQWLYARWTQHELSIAPAVNLVSNIGFNNNATHTLYDHDLANMPTEDIWTINHPPIITRDRVVDAYIFDNFYGGKQIKQYGRVWSLLRQKLISLEKYLAHRYW